MHFGSLSSRVVRKSVCIHRVKMGLSRRMGATVGSQNVHKMHALELGCFEPCGVTPANVSCPMDLHSPMCWVSQGHGGAVNALEILLPGDHEPPLIFSCGMDKTAAIWTLSGSEMELRRKIILSGGPAFCAVGDMRSEDGLLDRIYMGTHSNTVLSWTPETMVESDEYAVIGRQCGWVRSMVSDGRWLFSAACNQIQMFDRARAVPTLVANVTLDKGDILAMACTKDTLYAGTVDGCLYAFDVDRCGGISLRSCRTRAHSGRITDLVAYKGMLLSSSYDGSIKAWDFRDLEIVNILSNAHSGERITCLALGPCDALYSGGVDATIRKWEPNVLEQLDQPMRLQDGDSARCLACTKYFMALGTAKGDILVWNGDSKSTQ